MSQWLAVAAVASGGALGSVLRFLVGTWFLQRVGPGFPWGTFTINVSGSFAIGLVLQMAQTRIGLNPYARLFLAAGVLGGYTTFSTFAYETFLLSREAFTLQSLWYAFGSVLAGVAAAYLGRRAGARRVFIARLLRTARRTATFRYRSPERPRSARAAGGCRRA